MGLLALPLKAHQGPVRTQMILAALGRNGLGVCCYLLGLAAVVAREGVVHGHHRHSQKRIAAGARAARLAAAAVSRLRCPLPQLPLTELLDQILFEHWEC